MDNSIPITEEAPNKPKDFSERDQQEAYFLLCEIFSYAQATKNYVKFQSDLNEWKKRFPIDLFDESYRIKIKYMLSKEFLDTVLKNFIAFDELSKKNPSQGLEKLRKILDKAEKHKDAKRLDADLDNLYKEYPLNFLKEKYPHVVSHLLSKSNRTRILEKFDSSLAFRDLTNIIQNPQSYENVSDFKSDIDEWKKLYSISDFNDKFKPEVEKLLTETLDSRNLEKLFPIQTELDLSEGASICLDINENLKNISLVSKDALHEFFNIVDRNKNDVDSLFKWICKYNRYINDFDSSIKTTIVDNLMSTYAYELPPINTQYQISKIDSGVNDLLSLSDYENMDNTKKQVLLQVLGILSTGNELTNDDIYRLDIISSKSKKIEIIEKSKIEPKLNLFMEKFPEDKLIPSDELYLSDISNLSLDISTPNTAITSKDNNIVIENTKVHTDEESSSFKDALKVENTAQKTILSKNKNSSTSEDSSSGGSISLSANELQNSQPEVIADNNIEFEKKEPVLDKSDFINKTIENNIEAEDKIHAIILESNSNSINQDISLTKEENNYSEPENEPITSIDSEDVLVEEEILPKKSMPNFLSKFLGRKKIDIDRDDR